MVPDRRPRPRASLGAAKWGSLRIRPLACARRLGARGAAASDEDGSWRRVRARRIGGLEHARSPCRERSGRQLGRRGLPVIGPCDGASADGCAARRAGIVAAVHLMVAGRHFRRIRDRAIERRSGECRSGRQGQREAEPDQDEEPPHAFMDTPSAKRGQCPADGEQDGATEFDHTLSLRSRPAQRLSGLWRSPRHCASFCNGPGKRRKFPSSTIACRRRCWRAKVKRRIVPAAQSGVASRQAHRYPGAAERGTVSQRRALQSHSTGQGWIPLGSTGRPQSAAHFVASKVEVWIFACVGLEFEHRVVAGRWSLR